MLTLVAHLKTDCLVVLVVVAAGITRGHLAEVLARQGKDLLVVQTPIHQPAHIHLAVAEALLQLVQMQFLIALLALVGLE
jgi:dihydroxyacetone kinase-like predicted kinase